MSLRKRATVINFFSVVISIGLLYLASQIFLIKSYEQIEEQETTENLQRVTNALQDDIQSLKKVALGYAEWDETRDFILNGDSDYVENNLTDSVYMDTGLDIVVLTNTHGQLIFKKAMNRQTASEMDVPQSLLNQLRPGSVLLEQPDVESSISGILSLPEGNLIVISLPVSNNQGSGSINGYMIWGRFVDTEMMQQIIESTRLNANIVAYETSSPDTDYQIARNTLTVTHPFSVRAIDEQTVQGFTVMNDIFSQPALLIRVSMPRIVYQQGKTNLSYFLIALVLLTFVVSAITLLLLNQVILKRLRSLSVSVSAIQTTNDLTIPITTTGTDELARLANGIRGMLVTLGQSRSELLENNLQLEKRVTERTIQLERAKTRIEAIFHHSGDGIVLIDLEEGIQQGNQAFNLLFKALPDLFFGMPLSVLVDPADRDKLEGLIEGVTQSHLTQHIELRGLRSDNSRFEAEITLSSFNHASTSNISFVCIIRDISERKQAQQIIAEERNLLRTLIDAVPDYIYIKDTEHRLILNNVAHTRTLGGIQSSEVIGKTDFDLFPSEMAAKFHADEDDLFATGNPLFSREERSIGQDGSEIWALTTKVPLRNLKGEIIGLVGITHDVSGIKASEEALRQSEDRLQKALEKEKELNELKSRFVSMASHEFRTPLTIINTNAYLLQKRQNQQEDMSTSNDMRLVTIVNQVKYLSQIIDEVLDLTQVESQTFKLNLATADWAVFCVRIIDEVKNTAHDLHYYELTIPNEPVWVQFNPIAMRKVISNLISNAQKYSPSESKIKISIEKLQNTTRLSVSDEGIGIPEEDQKRLFEPFHRAENVGTIRGTGLGLVITKQAVEQHGGMIDFVSQPEIGTTFTITLPLVEINNPSDAIIAVKTANI